MTVHVPDRFKAANAFWIGLAKIGLMPAAVLSQARVPVTVYDGKKNLVTTAQFFALWRAVGELSSDPAAGLKIATQIDVGDRPPSTMAAFYAHDYRDALTRLARFKQLCSPEELQIKMSEDECTIEPVWLRAQEETPPLRHVLYGYSKGQKNDYRVTPAVRIYLCTSPRCEASIPITWGLANG